MIGTGRDDFGASVQIANNGFRVLVVASSTAAVFDRNSVDGAFQLVGEMQLHRPPHGPAGAAITYDGATVVTHAENKGFLFHPVAVRSHIRVPTNSPYPTATMYPTVPSGAMELGVDSLREETSTASEATVQERFSIRIQACVCGDEHVCVKEPHQVAIFENMIQYCLVANQQRYRVDLLRHLSVTHGNSEVPYTENYRKVPESPPSGENYPFDSAVNGGPVVGRVDLGTSTTWAHLLRSFKAGRYRVVHISGEAAVATKGQSIRPFLASFHVETAVEPFRLLPFLRQNDGTGWTVRVVAGFGVLILCMQLVLFFRRKGWRLFRTIGVTMWKRICAAHVVFLTPLSTQYCHESISPVLDRT